MSDPLGKPVAAAYLIALVIPVATLSFLVTMPHRWYGALPIALLAVALVALDRVGQSTRRRLSERKHSVSHDGLLIALAALEAINLLMLLRVAHGAVAWDTVVAVVLMGATTAHSAVVVAHELIHRRNGLLRVLGRILLWAGLYDHFYVEHLRGHHVRVARGMEPATARVDEPFPHFARRSLAGELASAWRLSWFQIAAELALAAIMTLTLGPAALVAFLLQASIAATLVTAVNYFQHYGVFSSGKRMSAADAWDCDAPLTELMLLGISRHADHHLHAGRTFAELLPSEHSPKLPHGYLRMILLVLISPRSARHLMNAELRRLTPPIVEG